MRSRAALLPHPADPFLFNYWYRFFKNVWGDEVDKLYVLVNSPMEQEVLDYMKSLVENDKKVEMHFIDHQIEHGDAINFLLDKCQEEYVMLIEDDGYIKQAGIVDEMFKKLESGEAEVIGSPRGSCGMDIWEIARQIWDLDYSHMGDNGPNFWPNFFFSKKQTLIDTDRNFAARAWKQGEAIEPLRYTVQEPQTHGDTFVNTSLQLRAKFPKDKIVEIPQYHGSTDDYADYEKGVNLFDGKCPWIHVGSLSSGTHGVLTDDQNRALARRKIDPPKEKATQNAPQSDQEKMEWERRIAFFSMFLDYYMLGGGTDPIYEFREEYAKALNRIVEDFNLNRARINQRKDLYRTIGL